jgi:inner membrane protein
MRADICGVGAAALVSRTTCTHRLDNLTHSLAGLIMGEAAIIWHERSAPPLTPRQRGALLTTAVLANNAPDLDFVYVGITGGKLGYLLHHRGHTHTLAALPALALLCLAIAALGFRSWRPARSVPARVLPELARLGAVATAGGVLHLLMDFGNNYGVHPFWPAYDGWFYGDAIFIIEPWLMILLIGMAGGVSTSRWLRAALFALLAALIALAWRVAIGGPWLALALGVFGLPWVLSLWRLSVRSRWRLGAASLAAFWLVLLGTRHVARASARDALADSDPGLELIELVSTPAPGNPLCWSLLAVQRSQGRYWVREAVASGWPGLSSAARCGFMNDGQTAPLQPSSLDPVASRRIVWGPEFRAPLDELASLRRDSCVARAFLRFARVPFWIRSEGRFTLVGDLRFDRSSAVEFAELPLALDAPCPRFEPPWLPPLAAFEGIESRR